MPAIVGPLRIGNKNDDVRTVQAALNGAGARPVLGADGKFGKLTHRAVMTFQGRKGLKCDGVVGPKTAAALNLGYSASMALLYPGRRPPPDLTLPPPMPVPPPAPTASATEI